MTLKAIDSYCQEMKVPRSRFLVDSAIQTIRSSKPNLSKCEYCSKEPAVGQFRLKIYSTDLGEEDRVLRLGQRCLYNAQKEKVEVTRLD